MNCQAWKKKKKKGGGENAMKDKNMWSDFSLKIHDLTSDSETR